MAMIDFAFGDQRRVTELYLSYLEAGGPAPISGHGSFTMVIAQFSHFWESADPRISVNGRGRCQGAQPRSHR
jgi:hypothetical protein